ncbi:MAG TPA: beta-galactosidase [Chloroflexi bacterium]|jgi:beta-galactosidase/beta-glucuronidase|nr:beta-galactosidase [Chloroflexota bacterium]
MEIPRPEYPRPQMERPLWLNLNGPWQFEFDPGLSGIDRGLPGAEALKGEIVVPYCPESVLSGIGDVDFHPGVWYRREVTIPEDWPTGRVLLHVGAADHDATVWVNSSEVGHHSGGYTPFTFDVTDRLIRGENSLVLHARDDTRSPLVAAGKQCPDYYSRRCHYTRTTGIWQTVWLEAVPESYIADLRMTPYPESGSLAIEVQIGGRAIGGTLGARATLAGEPVGEVEVRYSGNRATLLLPLNAVELWAPGQPTLYDLELRLATDDGARDVVTSYFGMRSISLSDRAILLNGRPFFQRLVLDQGYYPDGIYTAPSDEALRQDIVISQEMGFDGARLHQKVFEPRFLYWADRMGYLVWGEFANWGLDVSDPAALGVMLPQWLEAVRRDYNHPALVGWCPLNETQPDQDPAVNRGIYRATKAADPTRPVIDTSGYQHVETDIYDVHNYQQDPQIFAEAFAPFADGGEPFINRPDLDAPYAGQPYFVSEYGGIWWNPGQTDEVGWGYGGKDARPRTGDEFLARYRALTETLLRHPRMCAFCYTQLYDIEQEVNGLYTYDRRPKFEPQLIRDINTQKAAIEQ